jgi:ferredoxin
VPRVTFVSAADDRPAVVVELPTGASIFDAGGRGGVPIDTVCTGKGSCGKCRVRILAGAEQLTAYNAEEHRHLGNVYHLTKIRLSCQARLSETADVSVQVIHRPAPAKKR